MKRACLLLALALLVPVAARAQAPVPLPMGITDVCAGSVDTVPAGQTLVISGPVTKGCLAVHGTVQLAGGTLTVDTILVYLDGTLVAGTPTSPASGQIIIHDAPLDLSRDPDQYADGIVCLGTCHLYGAPVSTTFVRLSAEPLAGATTLTTSTPTNWHAGDRLVLPGTRQDQPMGEWENPTIAAVAGNVLTLVAPLQFNHRGARDEHGVIAFLPHVGNLTRSIVIRSANPNGTRGHVMGSGRADVDIRYVQIENMGRTTPAPLDNTSNHIGRYSLHMHHLTGPVTPQPNGYQFTLIGNAIEGGSKWGITVHDSHYGLVQDNVVFNVGGAGIVTEDGSETGNVFDHNFVVAVTGNGGTHGSDRQDTADWGWEGSGLWFRGPSNYVRNNVVANTASYGVTYMQVSGAVGAEPIPKKQGDDPMMSSTITNVLALPLKQFEGNELYAMGNGITTWNIGAACCTGVFVVDESVMKNTNLWHVARGFYGYGQTHFTIDGWLHRDDCSLLNGDTTMAIFFSDYLSRNTMLRHLDIQCMKIGVAVPVKVGDTRTQYDPYGSQPGLVNIEDSTLHTEQNVVVENMWAITGGGDNLPPRIVTIRNVLFGHPPGFPTNSPYVLDVQMVWHPDTVSAAAPSSTLDRTLVYSYNGNANDDFELFYKERGGAPCTQTNPETNGYYCGINGAVPPPAPPPVAPPPVVAPPPPDPNPVPPPVVVVPPVQTPPGSVDITALGVLTASVMQPNGGGSRNLEILRDGVFPPQGSDNSAQQYDQFGLPSAENWFSYTFPANHVFVGLTYQTGKVFHDGGWFATLKVQVRRLGVWTDIPYTISPTYAGAAGAAFTTYAITIPQTAGDGIRIDGPPGGSATFTAAAELRVFAAAGTPTPDTEAPVVTVTSPPGPPAAPVYHVGDVIHVAWTSHDNVGVVQDQCVLHTGGQNEDNDKAQPAACDASVDWPPAATAGAFYLDLYAFDAAGNSGHQRVEYTVLPVVPTPIVCLFTISSTSLTFAATGGTQTVDVVSNDASCPRPASSSQTWVTVSPAAGSGSGPIVVTAAANTGTTARTATVEIAGQPPIAVSQAAPVVVTPPPPPAVGTVFTGCTVTQTTPTVTLSGCQVAPQ